MNLTICYTTSRMRPEFDWFVDSLINQMSDGECLDIILVSLRAKKCQCWSLNPHWIKARNVYFNILEAPPKPTIWQGDHRITKENWWAMSNARNTALCLCVTDYIVWLDDRSVLMPGWMDGIKKAAAEGYAVCGTYEKRHGMKVVGGEIVEGGVVDGRDSRVSTPGVRDCFGQFWGGTMGCRVEDAIRVNGFEELVDGLGAEDYIFGMMLHNSGVKTMFDPSIKIIQDRTPSEIGTPMRKSDKGISPNDKSHAALARFGPLKRTQHPWDLNKIRADVLSGLPWPSVDAFPKTDWYDNQPISEFE